VCAVLSLALLGGGWLWLRGSSLVSVRNVRISGLRGPEAAQIRTALEDAAKHMTTLDFNAGALHSAVASFAVVSGLRVSTSFPHTVRISVTERLPVAVLDAGGQRTAIAADGTVLGPALLSGSLPSVNGSTALSAGKRIHEAGVLADAAVLGAAPRPLMPYIARVFTAAEGLTVAMHSGLLVYFGNATRPHAKWLSLTRVLASPSSVGAVYVDVRLPERPAAGFSSTSPSATTPASSSSSSTATSGQVAGAEAITAGLASGLENAVGGGAAATSQSSGSQESEAASTTEGQASAPGQSEAPTTSEAPITAEAQAPATGESEATPSG
jgi:cell division protein FtsQ